MIGLYLNIIIAIIFIIPFLKKETSKDVFVIWGSYFLSSVLALFFDPTSFSGFKKAEQYSTIHFVIYGILIFYALSPLYVIKRKSDRPNFNVYYFNKRERYVVNLAIVGGLYSFIYTLPFAIASLKLGAKEIRTYILVLEETTVLPPNFLTTIAVAFATFSSIYLGIFFLSLKSNFNSKKKFFLFIISLSYVVVSLCYTARDGLLFYLIFGLIFTLNYWDTFQKKLKKRILIGSLFLVLGAIFMLKSFTEDRFEDSSSGTMGYIASQPYVFAENIDKRSQFQNEYFYGLSLRFPVINTLLGLENKNFDRREQYEWTFGTFLTDFYNINGFFSLITFLIIFIEFFRYHLRTSKNNTMKFLLTYTFYMHFMISGLFYFRLGNFSGNVYIILVMILILIQKNKKYDYPHSY